VARKKLGNISKVLGGLGAAYALSKMAVGEGVRPEDVEGSQAHAAKLAREAARDGASVQTRGGRSAASAAPAEPFKGMFGYQDAQGRIRIRSPYENHVPMEEGSRLHPLPGFEKYEVPMKKGGKVSSGSKTASASRRGDGIAQRGKTRGRMV